MVFKILPTLAQTAKKIVTIKKVFSTKKLLRKKVSKLAAIANKRIKRLEKNNLVNSPVYKKWVSGGSKKFGVKGKTHNEAQQELSRLTSFLGAKSSTVRGVNKILKNIAKNVGIKYKNIKELQNKSGNFFKLADKVEEYLRSVNDIASAIGYQQIWESINEYVEDQKINLGDDRTDVEDLIVSITDLIEKKTINTNVVTDDGFNFLD